MNLSKGFVSHLIPIAIFFVLVSIFFAPLYSGKTLVQSDNVQLSGSMKEVADYREKGEIIHWSNKEFSGLPILTSSHLNPFGFISRMLFNGLFPKAIMMVFALFVGFYILLQVFGVSHWVSAIFSLAFAFSSFNFISIEVGHDNKVLAMAFMAPVLAGVIQAYRGKLFLGGIITFVSAGFQLYYGHIQITYYLLIMVLTYLILVVIDTIKSKDWIKFGKATGVLAIATVLAIGCNFSKLYSTLEYSSYSNRGGSELKTEGQSPTAGLSKDYAMAWSSGIAETFTLMFPYFYGGASGEELSEDSNTFQALASKGVDRQVISNITQRAPLYWGNQPFTQGPIYFGIIIVLLFIISLFILDGPFKWWGLGLTGLSLLLAMGKNLEWFNDFFFYYVPLYNKFRSVTMSFSIGQLIVPLLAALAFQKLVEAEDKKQWLANKTVQGSIAIGAIGILFMLFKDAFFNFKSAGDANFGFPEWLVNAIVKDRKSLFTSDIIRGLVFVALAGGLLWTYLKGYIKVKYVVVGLGLLILIDLWSVNKRYIGASDFETKRNNNSLLQPTQADSQILQDKGYYRVFNTTRRLDQDGITSYFHYSVGGYNAIKIQRYQELIERHLSQGNQQVINMLNVKYFITGNEQNQAVAQRNSGALGNAWFVNSLKMVENANEEIDQLNAIDTKETAVFDKRFEGVFDANATYSQEGSINLTSYHPEHMVYEFSSSEPQLVVFSDVYYAPGWNAYLDGEQVDYGRVNYILRGMEVPAGDHEIIFKYEPVSVRVGNVVIISFTLLGFALIVAGLVFKYKKVKTTQG
ncbi:MAG: YfhO family protein [Cyclobacteriaceae bacterium]